MHLTPKTTSSRSSFLVPSLNKGITRKEILEALRESRERAQQITCADRLSPAIRSLYPVQACRWNVRVSEFNNTMQWTHFSCCSKCAPGGWRSAEGEEITAEPFWEPDSTTHKSPKRRTCLLAGREEPWSMKRNPPIFCRNPKTRKSIFLFLIPLFLSLYGENPQGRWNNSRAALQTWRWSSDAWARYTKVFPWFRSC